MSFGDVRVALLADSDEIARIGNSYVSANACYEEAERGLDEAQNELGAATTYINAVGELIKQAMGGTRNVGVSLAQARSGADIAADASERAQGVVVGLCHELEAPAMRVLERTSDTIDPLAQEMRAHTYTIGEKAAVAEAGPTAKAAAAAKEAMNSDNEQVIEILALLAQVEDKLSVLGSGIEDSSIIIESTSGIVAEAKNSTADSQNAVASLSKEIAEVAYGL